MTAIDKIKLAKQASSVLAQSNSNLKNSALLAIARFLTENADAILEANAKDLDRAASDGLAPGLRDRLTLNSARIGSLVESLLQVASLPDPIGDVQRGMTLPNGLQLTQVAVPFGVVGAIYEARPNVTIDIAALALKAGNAVVLRGGTAAENTNLLLVSLIQSALESVGLPRDCAQTVDDFGRQGAEEMMQARGLIDVLIPRGSASLIKAVVGESKVPVIETGDGVVHIFVDESARLDWSVEIVHNSKVQRPSVCNALETLLIHEKAFERVAPAIFDRLSASGVTIHGDERVVKFFPAAVAATEADWNAEYYSLDLAVRVVSSLDEALDHIAKYSTHHTESIITESVSNSERFLGEVDSAVVMVNAATRFTDGAEFGFGAEVGISTQKLHARGPMGLPELTSTKWIVRGEGQTRV
jgi:glutamate-5-semialdehyde dehydrogenase